MADGSFPTLVSKDRNANAVANPMWVELTDGSTAVTITGNALSVNIANSSIAVTGTFYRDLLKGIGVGEDNILIFANTNKDGSGTDYVPLVDSDGQLQVDVLTMPAIRTITKATDSIQISKDTAVNSSTNPIYVSVTSDVISATEIHDYDTEVDLAVDTPDSHDYTVAGTTFLLKSVIFAASGGLKIEVKVGPVATLVTKAVAFIARQGGFGQIDFNPPIEVPVTSTGTVRVIRTNRQGAVMDVYSTIIGNDLP